MSNPPVNADAKIDLPTQIEVWKQQYEDIYELNADADEGDSPIPTFYFRKPGRMQLSRFAKEVMKDALKGMNALVFDCLLFPDRDTVEALFKKKPGLIISLGGELQKLVGTSQDFFVKRL